MLIAHLPAGYLMTRATRAQTQVFWAMLAGSVLPDIDILWFLFVDQGSTHHHSYLAHRPLIWAQALLIGLVMSRPVIAGLGAGGLLHMALDSIAGRIDWGWPFVEFTVMLVDVPATQSHWVWSFMLHWTFAVELMICLVAGALLWRTR